MSIRPAEPADRDVPAAEGASVLPRRFGLLQATALNMTNMIGVGPFITIPLLMTALGGPQAMLGWLVALLIVIPDGMVWSELGSAMPGSGGSYVYLRQGYGPERWGRLASFLFIWQFILSGPLEIASGYIGFSQYLGYLWPSLTELQFALIAAFVGVINIVLLYRPIGSLGRLTVLLWSGTLLTTAAVIFTGARHFDVRIAFDFPPGAFNFSLGLLIGLGGASRVAIYDYLGYYDICYIGDEVKDPVRVIPRSILLSIVLVAMIYLAINLSVIGVVPWREFVPAADHPSSKFIVSVFMEKVYGPTVASLFHRRHPLDRIRIGVRAAPRLLAHSVRCGEGWQFLLRLRPAPSHEAVPAHLAPGRRRRFHRVQLLFAGNGHRCAHHDADSGAVHGADRRGGSPSAAPREPPALVPDVALSTAKPPGACGLDFRLRHL